ncbi:MAG: class I SAM-dependent methyltransferase [Verrucomicrobiia bacterium]
MTSGDRFAWEAYTRPDAQANFAPGAIVIDVGCGNGKELKQLAKDGCVAIGLDVDATALADCRRANLPVVLAPAEHMPLRAQAFDGLICNVAIPYTDESQVMQEIGRILKRGARGYLCFHGSGYFLRYVVAGPSFRMRFYGVRSMLNTWYYRVTGRRLSGFWGDTLYQTHGRLLRYYRRDGLKLLESRSGKTFLGFPVFIYHLVERI